MRGESALAVASMSYSRDAEREADEYARERMAESDISPVGAAQFFERMIEENGGEEKEGEEKDGGFKFTFPMTRATSSAPWGVGFTFDSARD